MVQLGLNAQMNLLEDLLRQRLEDWDFREEVDELFNSALVDVVKDSLVIVLGYHSKLAVASTHDRGCSRLRGI